MRHTCHIHGRGTLYADLGLCGVLSLGLRGLSLGLCVLGLGGNRVDVLGTPQRRARVGLVGTLGRGRGILVLCSSA